MKKSEWRRRRWCCAFNRRGRVRRIAHTRPFAPRWRPCCGCWQHEIIIRSVKISIFFVFACWMLNSGRKNRTQPVGYCWDESRVSRCSNGRTDSGHADGGRDQVTRVQSTAEYSRMWSYFYCLFAPLVVEQTKRILNRWVCGELSNWLAKRSTISMSISPTTRPSKMSSKR